MTEERQNPANVKPDPAGKGWADVLIGLRWPLVAVALLAVGLVVYLETLERADRVGRAARELAEGAVSGAERVVRGFLTGDVTERFVSSIPKIDSDGSGRLELATLEATETFTRTDERRVLWDTLSLGTTVAEIQVPVTYRYHLRLDDPWRVEVAGGVCVVHAPPIRPTQPPAIHTEGMEKRSEEDWLRFDADEQMAELERSLTPRLRARAGSPRHLALVRDEARRTVAEFVRAWLLLEGPESAERLEVKVVFPGEDDRPSVDRRPTIEEAREGR